MFFKFRKEITKFTTIAIQKSNPKVALLFILTKKNKTYKVFFRETTTNNAKLPKSAHRYYNYANKSEGALALRERWETEWL